MQTDGRERLMDPAGRPINYEHMIIKIKQEGGKER